MYALQPVRQVGQGVRRLLVRQHVHLGAGLLPAISLLPARLEEAPGHRERLRLQRKMRQQTPVTCVWRVKAEVISMMTQRLLGDVLVTSS